MRRLFSGFDVKLFVAIIVSLLLAIMLVVAVSRSRALTSAVDQGKELAGVVKTQSKQIGDQNRQIAELTKSVNELNGDSAARSKAAAADRRHLARLLRQHGIDVPPELTSPPTSSSPSSPAHRHHVKHHKAKPKKKPHKAAKPRCVMVLTNCLPLGPLL